MIAGGGVTVALVVLGAAVDEVAVALLLLEVAVGENTVALLLLGSPVDEVAVALLLLPEPFEEKYELELLELLLTKGLACVGEATAITKLPTRQRYKA
jgi:hypothetical protein